MLVINAMLIRKILSKEKSIRVLAVNAMKMKKSSTNNQFYEQ